MMNSGKDNDLFKYENRDILLASIYQKLENLINNFDDFKENHNKIHEKQEKNFKYIASNVVKKSEFFLIRVLVYGFAGAILLAFATSMIGLVITNNK